MADITIRVRNRIAEAVGSPEIICGNSDYNAIFDLDAEWDAQEIKTMRVAWTDTFSGQPRHIDVPFFMGFAAIPAIADAYEVQIGIYTGNIMTTTPARVPCVRCITDGGTYHEDPEPETYAALLEAITHLAPKVEGAIAGNAVVKYKGCYGMVERAALIYDTPTLVLTITKTRSAQNYGTIDEIYFYDQNQNRITPSIFAVRSNAVSYTDFENEQKCLDGDTSTKWLWYWQNPTVLVVTLTQDFRPAFISYVTGNDYPDRDPVSFDLEYRYQKTSKTILRVSDAEITTARVAETQKFACSYDD